MHRLLVAVLQLGIVAVFLAGLFGQIVVLPTTAADDVAQFPPYAPYEVPYVTVAIIGVACVGAFGTAALTTGAGVAFIMLMVIMRGLLRKATRLQMEMAELV